MTGETVPLIMLPRFTSLLGPGTYTTVPLLVSEYKGATIEFWRGVVKGQVGSTFEAWLEQANEPFENSAQWTAIGASITMPNTSTLLNPTFNKRYFRIRIQLVASSDNLVGISCWAAGVLEKRLPE